MRTAPPGAVEQLAALRAHRARMAACRLADSRAAEDAAARARDSASARAQAAAGCVTATRHALAAAPGPDALARLVLARHLHEDADAEARHGREQAVAAANAAAAARADFRRADLKATTIANVAREQLAAQERLRASAQEADAADERRSP